jgi:hypothetical protein
MRQIALGSIIEWYSLNGHLILEVDNVQIFLPGYPHDVWAFIKDFPLRTMELQASKYFVVDTLKIGHTIRVLHVGPVHSGRVESRFRWRRLSKNPVDNCGCSICLQTPGQVTLVERHLDFFVGSIVFPGKAEWIVPTCNHAQYAELGERRSYINRSRCCQSTIQNCASSPRKIGPCSRAYCRISICSVVTVEVDVARIVSYSLLADIFTR